MKPLKSNFSPQFIGCLLLLSLVSSLWAQTATPQQEEKVRAIAAPKNPLPPEDKSANVTKFSFVVFTIFASNFIAKPLVHQLMVKRS